ncbi:MAG TPA: hypothetical protein ENJ64_01805 [Thiotrichales bacterium]|nr:hypothetical protein [Thiotrichales bacterium]
MTKTANRLLLLILTSIVILGSYLLLRYQYQITDQLPFAQEVVLIIMGTLMTVLITALLLNKQTEVELRKEQNIRYLELKSELYMRIINDLEKVIASGELTSEDLLHLEFFSHQLAIAASPDVLQEFYHFIKTITPAIADQSLSDTESDDISRALAKITVCMRKDILGQSDRENNVDLNRLYTQIIGNADLAIKSLSHK